MAKNKVYITLEVDDKGSATMKQFGGNTEKAFDKLKKNAKAGGAQAGKMERAWEKSMSHMKAHWKGYALAGGAALAATAAVIAATSRKAIAAASDLQEVQGKFDVVFAGQEKKAEAWSKTLVDSYAMSMRESKEYLSSIQDLLVPMGMAADKAGLMSNEVVKLSADLGSFNNLPTEKVMEDIQSALVGNYETMKKYGVVLNATVVQEKALAMGLADTKDGLTAGMKAQASYQLMVEGSTAAIGDMARTQDSAANQEKQTKALLEDITALLGKALIPYYQAALKEVNKWLKANKGMIKQNLPKYMETVGDAIVFVIKTMRFFHNAWLGIKLAGTAALHSVAVGIEELVGGIRFLLTPIDLLFEGLKKIGVIDVNPFDKIEESLGQFRASSADVTKEVMSDIAKTNKTYDLVIKKVKGWQKQIKAIPVEQGKTEKKIIKSLKNIGKVQTKMTKAEIKAAKDTAKAAAKLAKDKAKAVTEFSKKYQKLTLGDHKYAVEQLKDQARAYEVAGADHLEVEKWVSAEIGKLVNKEAIAASKLAKNKIRLAEYYRAESTRSHGELAANISSMTQKEVTEALKAAADKAKAIKDYARESTRIYEQLSDDVQKIDLDDYGYKQQLLTQRYDNYKLHLESLAGQDSKYADGVKLLDTWVDAEKDKLWDDWAKKHGTVLDRMEVRWRDYQKEGIDANSTMYDTISAGIDNTQGQLSDNLFHFFKGETGKMKMDWESLWDSMLKTMADQLARMATEWAFSGAKDWFIKGGAGGILGTIKKIPIVGDIFGTIKKIPIVGDFLGGFFHKGGVVGSSAMPMQTISPIAFATAPRLHSGFRPDEFPAILQKGERVLSRREYRDIGGERGLNGGANNVNITIQADVITTDDVDNWLADRIRRLKDYKVGDEYQTVNIMTAGLET